MTYFTKWYIIGYIKYNKKKKGKNMATYKYQIIYKHVDKRKNSKSAKMDYNFVELINGLSAIEKYSHKDAIIKITVTELLPISIEENERLSERDKEYLKKYWSA